MAFAEEQQMDDELSELLHGLQFIPIAEPDAQTCGGLPEMSPAAGEHARPHGVLRRQEREEVMEGVVRERADAIAASIRRRRTVHFSPFPRRHSCEQMGGIAAGQEGGEKERNAYSD